MTKEELEEKGVAMMIQQDDGTHTTIQHYDCNKAHRTLGLYKTITGNQDKILKQTKEKSEKITIAVGAANLSKDHARIAWNAMYIPAVAYPFVATYMTEKDLVKVENKVLMTFLPRKGYNRKTPRAVVYGPEQNGGLGIKNLYAEQSLAQINALLQHKRMGSPLGKIIAINLEWVQIIAGIQKPIFEDTKPLQHLEVHWFKSIRQFLHITKGTVILDGVWTPQLERTKDQCIMEAVRKCKETEQINRVQIYLQATTLADITNAEGTQFTETALGRTPDMATCNNRRSKHAWPRQPRPGPKSWRWKTALLITLSIAGKSNQLRDQLGPWTINNRDRNGTGIWTQQQTPCTKE